ncbi:hypothetical protein V5799_029845 [Amblyomma americanum]|uniref:Uncharacterized protein n=1 Tax=Amblyomma americanum TaxID=6943 RepID=A0AAQ4EPU7_AMBAM
MLLCKAEFNGAEVTGWFDAAAVVAVASAECRFALLSDRFAQKPTQAATIKHCINSSRSSVYFGKKTTNGRLLQKRWLPLKKKTLMSQCRAAHHRGQERTHIKAVQRRWKGQL